jgi:hypothetical protein
VEGHVRDKFLPLRIVHQLLRRGEELGHFHYGDWAQLFQDLL